MVDPSSEDDLKKLEETKQIMQNHIKTREQKYTTLREKYNMIDANLKIILN